MKCVKISLVSSFGAPLIENELKCAICGVPPHSHVAVREDLYSMGWEPERYLSSMLDPDFE